MLNAYIRRKDFADIHSVFLSIVLIPLPRAHHVNVNDAQQLKKLAKNTIMICPHIYIYIFVIVFHQLHQLTFR